MHEIAGALTISNIRITSEHLPFQLTKGALLRKASDWEIREYKKLIAMRGSFGRFFIPYDEEITKQGERVACEPRWWTLETNDWGNYLEDINGIGKLLKNRLHFALSCGYSDEHHLAFSIKSPPSYYELQSMEDYTHEEVTLIDQTDLAEFRQLYTDSFENEGADEATIRAIRMFLECDTLPPHSPLLNLSYFSIIECLLTEKSESNPNSITHQIKKKTQLIFNLNNEPIITPEVYLKIQKEKLWVGLYNLRSKIAHGGKIDFKSSELSHIVSILNANSFIKESIRVLIRFSIRNPNLIQDLRRC